MIYDFLIMIMIMIMIFSFEMLAGMLTLAITTKLLSSAILTWDATTILMLPFKVSRALFIDGVVCIIYCRAGGVCTNNKNIACNKFDIRLIDCK